MDPELIVRLLTDFRQEMNARFERLEDRMERRFEGADQRLTQVNLELTVQIAAVTRSLNEELLVGRRELRSRLDRCERELDELRRRDRD